jgi:hypothetical protein
MINAFLKRAESAAVRVPLASNRSSRVIKVIKVALNIKLHSLLEIKYGLYQVG